MNVGLGMNLTDRLTHVLRGIHSIEKESTPHSVKDIISLMDLTCLDTAATPTQINQLAMDAEKYQTATVCIFPEHLDFISSENSIPRATVLNFPGGNEPITTVLNSITLATNHHLLKDIDYVFPYALYLSGYRSKALAHCQQAYECSKQYGLTFKVILETGALPSNEVIYDLSTSILNQGCDFLKTSTGKIAQGATIPAVFSILSAIVDTNSPCGIKVSGGVTTAEQACAYIQLAEYMLNKKVTRECFRLGASSLLKILTDNLIV